MSYRILIFLLASLVANASRVHAEFFVAVRDATPLDYMQSTSGVLEVWGGHNENTAIELSGWTLGFKLSDPTVWSSFTLSSPFLPGANLLTTSGNPSLTPGNIDFLVRTNGGTPTSLAANSAQKLFQINFTVSPTATPQDNYSLSFLPNASYLVNGGPATQNTNLVNSDLVNYNHGDGNLLGFNHVDSPFSSVGFTGRFNVTAIPEPSSLALVGLVGAGLGFYRRRRVDA